jgi:segregation and condensation protein B
MSEDPLSSPSTEPEFPPAPAEEPRPARKGRKARRKEPTAEAGDHAVNEAVTETAPEPEAPTESPEGEAAEPTVEEPVEAAEPADESPSAAPDQLPLVLEAILFASQKPMAAKEILSVLRGAADAAKETPDAPARAFAKVKEHHLRDAVEVLENLCAAPDRAYEVRESAAGWQLVTKPQYAPWLRQLFPEHRAARLSAPAMETLAIIAYRQPITRADIEAVRGVAVDGVMQTLLDRGLVKIAGRADVPGRPLLYDTTQNFMEHFGLKNLDDLPNAAELRKIRLPTAEVAAPAEPAAPEGTEPAAPVEENPQPVQADASSGGTTAESTADRTDPVPPIEEVPGEASDTPPDEPSVDETAREN